MMTLEQEQELKDVLNEMLEDKDWVRKELTQMIRDGVIKLKRS